MRTYTFVRFGAIWALLTLSLATGCESYSVVNETIGGYSQEAKDNGEGLHPRLAGIVELCADSVYSLSSVLQLEITDNLYFVRDENGLFSFDKTGKPVRKYGNRGKGRGEYVNLSCFYLSEEGNVCIVDDYKQSVIEFSADGRFLSERKSDDPIFSYVGRVASIPKEKALFCSFMINPANDDFYAKVGQTFQKNAVCKSDFSSDHTSEMYGHHPFSIYDGKIKYVKPYDNSIYTYGQDSKMSIEIPENMVMSLSEGEKKDYTYLHLLNDAVKDRFVGFTDIFETDKVIMLGVSNYDYVIIDKKKGECTHYRYSIPDIVTALPLVNIMASGKNALYGVLTPYKVNVDDETIIRNEDFGRIAEAIEHVKKTDHPAILIYDMSHEK